MVLFFRRRRRLFGVVATVDSGVVATSGEELGLSNSLFPRICKTISPLSVEGCALFG